MKIDDLLLAKLQRLGSINLEEEKLQETKENLSEIVNFVENINSLELENIPASFNPLDSKGFMREDLPCGDENIAKDILSHAPLSEESFFIVPKIIE
ncbi:Asp-tRNA(Asn)/Glu-tRNA(Gln) amidotransferase subunit GatC [Helicobacter burdigaliensis]|uniref:Asp-tRNA(Asn)/Glu-tRNA(Gln) amidotransferase subunit GatC n=1 Tax=Helicobacter burdigaliensis TaxID=2315334 RepID=UPI000EF6B7AC|nr:Asp-tRNA(Asn)/Glu-tRNA(Gln) amidotransferase subunit GatC [Helicobacter burdigaliensis]